MSAFISFDGGEGVGKTTQMKLLRERLPALFPDTEFLFTREPGGSPLAETIRDVILKEGGEADGKTMFGLFAAARADHISKVILPNLKAGKVVISDRFVAATYAYQVAAMQNPISEELFAEYYKNLDVVPDFTAILDMDPEIAQARIQSRRGDDSNHFDTRDLKFHEDLRDGYHVFSKNYSKDRSTVLLIDANRDSETVHQDLVTNIRSILLR